MNKIIPSLVIVCFLIFALSSNELNPFARAFLQVNLVVVGLSSLWGIVGFLIFIIKNLKERKSKIDIKELISSIQNKIFLFLEIIQNNLFKILVVLLLLLLNHQIMGLCNNFKKEIEYVQKQLENIESEVDGFYGDWFRKYF